MRETIAIYNRQLNDFLVSRKANPTLKADDFVDFGNNRITWTREIKWDLEKGKAHEFIPSDLVTAVYRPFVKQNYYFNKDWNNTLYQIPKLFPKPGPGNVLLCVP